MSILGLRTADTCESDSEEEAIEKVGEEMLAAENLLVNFWTATFKDAAREADFTHNRCVHVRHLLHTFIHRPAGRHQVGLKHLAYRLVNRRAGP